ncbi:MAG: hypothetical protein CVU89_09810 [Firmicutes bacterium HGW-Firmicutes-14]|nr:MAG: hypothetical protein CVU89_09810 [Firmicutes bacterium HGW-Firmicutes-14]
MAGKTWQEFFANNLGKIIGVTIGLLLGWMIIEYGLLKTLFVIILIILGYLFGKQADDGESLSALVNRIFRR